MYRFTFIQSIYQLHCKNCEISLKDLVRKYFFIPAESKYVIRLLKGERHYQWL